MKTKEKYKKNSKKYLNKKKYEKGNMYEAKKKYGQNFLEDTGLLTEILKASNVSKESEVFEIGPGLGFLTGSLLKESKFLTAFEIDDDLIPVLEKKFGNMENFLLVHEDFMTVDLKKYVEGKKDIKVVANIPYYITSPIINRLIEFRENISEIYLMVQKEVAERIAAKPKSRDMSLLTHAVQFYGEAQYLFTVNKEKFTPVPKVDSAFVKIEIFKDRRYERQISEKEYFKYLKAAFSAKRKSLGNNLTELGYSKSFIVEILEKTGKGALARAEEFSLQEFIDLIKYLKEAD